MIIVRILARHKKNIRKARRMSAIGAASRKTTACRMPWCCSRADSGKTSAGAEKHPQMSRVREKRPWRPRRARNRTIAGPEGLDASEVPWPGGLPLLRGRLVGGQVRQDGSKECSDTVDHR